MFEVETLRGQLEEKSRAVLAKNLIETAGMLFHQPAPGLYQSLFAWDSGWHIIALSILDPELAFRELETLLSFQHADGSIPHEVRIKGLEKTETLLRRIYVCHVGGQFDGEGRSRFIDPPSYLLAAEFLYRRTADRRILALLPKLRRCLDYLTEERNLFGDGLVAILHPWESGTDNAPVYDIPCGIDIRRPWWPLTYEMVYTRYLKRLIEAGWNPHTIIRDKGFVFEDVGMNGLTAAGALALARLYRAAGDEVSASVCDHKARIIIAACEQILWNDKRGFFYPRWNLEHPKQSFRTCLNGMAPLLTGLVDPAKADRVFDVYLASPRHFACKGGVAFNSRSEEDLVFFPNLMLWRGPCMWISMNWIAAEAAAVYGKHGLASDITAKTARLIAENGFREYYDPYTGKGMGAQDFTWPTLVVDMIDRHGLDFRKGET